MRTPPFRMDFDAFTGRLRGSCWQYFTNMSPNCEAAAVWMKPRPPRERTASTIEITVRGLMYPAPRKDVHSTLKTSKMIKNVHKNVEKPPKIVDKTAKDLVKPRCSSRFQGFRSECDRGAGILHRHSAGHLSEHHRIRHGVLGVSFPEEDHITFGRSFNDLFHHVHQIKSDLNKDPITVY